jgi:uncharacterized membrane protein YtjA (UPF0391 family)
MTDRHDPIGPPPHSEGRSSLRARRHAAPVCIGAGSAFHQEAGTAKGVETIVFVVVIVLIVLGYFGRGRRA